VTIYGGVGDNIPGVTQEVKEGDTFSIGETEVKVLFTPCHTAGHVCYLARTPGEKSLSLFTGDTLFVAGCGNFNDGTPAQMFDALINKISILPPDTKVMEDIDWSSRV
jgi:hydroxyacylglutathione hydrolase